MNWNLKGIPFSILYPVTHTGHLMGHSMTHVSLIEDGWLSCYSFKAEALKECLKMALRSYVSLKAFPPVLLVQLQKLLDSV